MSARKVHYFQKWQLDLTVDFSTPMEASVDDTFMVVKQSNGQPKILHSAESSRVRLNKQKLFSMEQNWRES